MPSAMMNKAGHKLGQFIAYIVLLMLFCILYGAAFLGMLFVGFWCGDLLATLTGDKIFSHVVMLIAVIAFCGWYVSPYVSPALSKSAQALLDATPWPPEKD